MKMRIRLAAPLIALSLAVAGAAFAQSGDQLGKVQFQNSCSPAVQAKLQRGVAMLHSFYYSAAKRPFEEVGAGGQHLRHRGLGLRLDPDDQPARRRRRLAQGRAERAQAAIEKGRKMGAKTQRERDYLEAVAAYYEDFANRPERERQVARAKAYETLAAKYPDDDEAQIFYAVYLAGTQLQTDQTYAAYLKAATILEKQFKKHPSIPASRTT